MSNSIENLYIATNFTFKETLLPRKSTKYVIVHHSEILKPHNVNDVHQLHLKLKMAGIGYHFFIRKDGSIYQGRPLDTVGAHVRDFNSASVGVCFEGHFDLERINDLQYQKGVELIAAIVKRYPGSTVKFHNQYTTKKNCPGKLFPCIELLQDVMAKL